MARGAEEKATVQATILETFAGAFVYGKEIRVPVGDVQIKVTLTCAKENVEPGGDTATPGESIVNGVAEAVRGEIAGTQTITQPTEEEIAQVNNFIEKLGL